MAGKSYVLFQSTRLHKLFSFLQPANWQVREVLEDGYERVFVTGPRNHAATFTASLMVRILSVPDETPQEATDLFVSKYRSAFNAKILGQAIGTLDERPAAEVEITYSMSLPLNSVNPQPTNIRERHIFVRHDGQLLELLYAADEEDYATWLEAFHIFAQTFSFSQRDKELTFHPFIAEAEIDTTKKCGERESGEKPQ